MDRIRIVGGQRLNGTIPISGAKNATLPFDDRQSPSEDTLILENVPRLADVIQLQRILGNHGVDIIHRWQAAGRRPNTGLTLHISAKHIVDTTAPYELVSQDAGELLGGGPAAGAHGRSQGLDAGWLRHRHAAGRPLDHGAGKARRRNPDRSRLRDPRAKRLRGGEINFPKVTVGGTIPR